jgi:hypothetical protein
MLRAGFVAAAGLCGARINRFDLHHAHWWATDGASGLLFHAREYPAKDALGVFQHELGFCQTDSELVIQSGEEMTRRNVLWILGEDRMHLLDAERLVGEEMAGVWTVDEGSFGERVADIFYFGKGDADAWGGQVFFVPYK